MHKAIFLDRDGTLNPDPGYINSPEDFSLFPEIPSELAKLKKAGFLLVVVTNQSGISRKIIDPKNLCLIHQKLQNELAKVNVTLDRIYVCPHHPDFPIPSGKSVCDCRKPQSGLIFQAIRDLNLTPSQCYIIGDRESDVLCGINASVASVLIAKKPLKNIPSEKYQLCETFTSAVKWILEKEKVSDINP
ncbi:MAG: HAD family hydrolase [Candidatus Riflebacteria bacterium]|nr:HAD family hydrolase [Candidatus Riflebacteria bacterium]